MNVTSKISPAAKRVWRWVGGGGRWGTLAALLLALCGGGREGRAAASDAAGGGAKSLEIYWVDVEGGGATLIVTPAGESILVDTGNPGVRDSSRIHRVATEVAGLKRIDHLVTTHFHIDHFGGAAELAALMPIGQVHDNGLPETDPDGNRRNTRWPLMIKPYREMKVEGRQVVKPGGEIVLRQAGPVPVRLRWVAARQEYQSAPEGAGQPAGCASPLEKPKDTSDNANSVALVLECGPFRFFNGGDMTWNTEAGLVCPVNRVGTVDVYQVNHHGLDVSNNPLLVHTLAPTVSVMNNGPRKGTAQATVETLRKSPGIQAMYQVHKNVRDAHNTGDEFIANLEEKCSGNHLRLTVAPDGRSYTMRVPGTPHARTFTTRAGGR